MTRPRQTAKGPGQRQLRVGAVLRRALSDIFARGDVHDPALEGVSITVSEVRPSPDLKVAQVYVLPLAGRDTDAVMEALHRAAPGIRRMVTGMVDLKFSPELRFVADESFDRMDRTREILASPAVRRDLDEE